MRATCHSPRVTRLPPPPRPQSEETNLGTKDELPRNWKRQTDEDGNVVFYNMLTKETTQHHPRPALQRSMESELWNQGGVAADRMDKIPEGVSREVATSP